MPQNAAPPAGEEAAIFGTMAHLPDAQSFRELGALNSRVTTAMRAARSDPAQAQTYARLSQLRSSLANILQDSVESQAGQDAAAVRAGTMAPKDSMMGRWSSNLADARQDWYAGRASIAAASDANGRGLDRGDIQASGTYAGGRPRAFSGVSSAESVSRRGFPDTQGHPGLSSQAPPLVANADQAAVDRIAEANAAYGVHKQTYGAKVPGVGPVLAPGPTQGTFLMHDSAVPSAIFSKGTNAAEKVQAAIHGGLTAGQIANFAAFDLRSAATNADGTLNPAKFARWRQQNAAAFEALAKADPSVAGRFDTAQQASQRLVDLQSARTALDATHPLNPGWGDAEVMQRVWQGGPKGADSVRAATSAAGGSPIAASSIADYAAYSLRKAAAPDGVLDPRKYAQWVKTYDGAISARPDIKAQFDNAAAAQRTLNNSAEDHAVALRNYQNSVARHFLGGADPADRIGQILNSATRQRDMAELARLTETDPAARAGIQRAVVDHIFSRLQSNALAGESGIEKLKSDQFQSFVNRAAPALHDVMSPQQVDAMRRIALTLQRDNLSVDGTRVPGGSDSTQKIAGMIAGKGSSLMGMAKVHGVTGLLTILGAKMGPVGAYLGNKAGAGFTALKAAGISQTNDLVKEAMLHPALARVLLEQLTPSNEKAVASRAMVILRNLSATRGASTAVAAQHAVYPQTKRQPVRLNSLADLGAAMPMASTPNQLSSLGR
ncbi:hypothetical protein [Acidisphaera sp. L21]|uniref:hypothetical protein n=1 Tax=Acidisphaera sp. L21 TaxID=1641851 RepID=UPI00131C6149|nr:hypothetical protein [Acidisphaera sp. L21]